MVSKRLSLQSSQKVWVTLFYRFCLLFTLEVSSSPFLFFWGSGLFSCFGLVVPSFEAAESADLFLFKSGLSCVVELFIAVIIRAS